MIWLMIKKAHAVPHLKYIKPEPPCQKGEIDFCLFGLSLTVGWQDKGGTEK